jgi:CheY-like chemotaxis protein
MHAAVLVVDDNPINRQLTADILSSRGFTVIQAADAVSAMDLLERSRPDAALLDVQMPGMNGIEAIIAIRRHADPAVASTPIAAMTALAMPGDKERCLEAGADVYLPRPVHLQTLIEQVTRLVKIRPRP